MKVKKLFLIIIPFLLAAFIIGYTPKSKNAETASYYIKKEKFDTNTYLEKNHTEIDVDDCSGFNLLDEDINKNDVILTGEYNAVNESYQAKLSMLKYMNKKYNVRYLLEEIGYSQSCFINEYLKTGDESLLKFVYNYSEGPIIYTWLEENGFNGLNNKKSYDFWIKLRKYNETLTENKRITVIGIDVENQVGTALKYINSLLPENKPIAEIEPYIKDLENIYKQKNFTGVVRVIQNLQNNMETNPNIYEKYLGTGYFDFHFIIDNIINTSKIYNASGIDMKKALDSSIYSNFKKIYSNLPKGKYLGEFDMENVYQNTCLNMEDVTSFAMYLNSSGSPMQGRVLSIVYDYQNSKTMPPLLNQGEADEGFFTDIDILQNISKSDITLFKLNGENSPFTAKSYFVTGIGNKPATDYFKYIILIKNSKAEASMESSK